MVDIRLKVFRSVAQNLSFTKASQELYISQPAISKHIQELEAEYHVRLFDRLGNRISLTHAGQLLLDHCQRIFSDYQHLDFEMNALRKKYSGEIRIGASTTISQYVMPEILADFVQQYPQTSISVLSGNSRDIEAALQGGKIDIGMVEGIIRQPQLKYSAFMKDELVAIVSAENVLVDKDEITISELQNTPLVLREHGSGTLDVVENALQNKGLSLSDMKIVMYLGSTESIKGFIAHSNSMGIVSVRSVSKALLNGEFKVIEIKGLKMEREFCFVEKRGESSGMQTVFKKFITSGYRL
ncbi:MAG TPA: LysR substrate-binding domain-containing protein [Xylanibacter oryzae]|nr:LysR substrate-binding domain-containing protein [Xylanibacter oryzae]